MDEEPPWELGSLLIWWRRWKKMKKMEEREREWGGREREEKLGILEN